MFVHASVDRRLCCHCHCGSVVLTSESASVAVISCPTNGGVGFSVTVAPQLLKVAFVIVRVPPSSCTQRDPSWIVAPDRSAVPPMATRMPYQSSLSAGSSAERKVMSSASASSVPLTINSERVWSLPPPVSSVLAVKWISVPSAIVSVTLLGIVISPFTLTLPLQVASSYNSPETSD